MIGALRPLHRTQSFLFVALVALASCGDDDTVGGDAAVDARPGSDGGTRMPTVVAPPESPALPATPARFSDLACPSGWTRVDVGSAEGAYYCDPWPEGRAPCAAPDEERFTGSAACERIGTACPAGEWSDAIPAGATTLYVRAGGPAGGSGTADAPFGTIAEALAVATPGAIVALGKGTYDERVSIPAGVTILGACVAETAIAISTRVAGSGAIHAETAGGAVRNVAIRGEAAGIVALGSGTTLDVADVVIESAYGFGVLVTGAMVTASRIALRDTRFGADANGVGAVAVDGGTLRLTTAVVSGNHVANIAGLDAGTSVALRDVAAIDGQAAGGVGIGGFGVLLGEGAVGVMENVVAEGNRGYGIGAGDAGTRATCHHCLARDTREDLEIGEGGRGFGIENGATVEITSSAFLRNAGAGILGSGTGAAVTLSDVVVLDDDALVPEPPMAGLGVVVGRGARLDAARVLVDGVASACLLALAGAASAEDLVLRRCARGMEVSGIAGAATLRRVRIEEARVIGVNAGDAASLDLEDVSIRRMRGDESGRFGTGLQVGSGATATIRRLLVAASLQGGVAVEGAGTHVEASDVTIADNVGAADGTFGRGLQVSHGAAFQAARVAIDRNREMGIAVMHEGTIAELTDLTVRDTATATFAAPDGTLHPGMLGRALAVELGGRARVERGLFERNAELGAGARGAGSTLDLVDVAVRDTRASGFVDGTEGMFGRAINVQEGGRVTVLRGIFERNREATILVLKDGASLVAEDVVISETLVRECVTGSCPDNPAGSALVVAETATAVLTNFEIRRSALCGVQIASAGEVDLHDGDVVENTCGVNVQVPGYDLARLQDRVRFVDNGVTIDARALPIPGGVQ